MVMPETPKSPRARKSTELWKSSRYTNLVRYVPSGIYFARVRVAGKLFRDENLREPVLRVPLAVVSGFQKRQRRIQLAGA